MESLRETHLFFVCRASPHVWFSGRILACHARGPGSIPIVSRGFVKCVYMRSSFDRGKDARQPGVEKCRLDERGRPYQLATGDALVHLPAGR